MLKRMREKLNNERGLTLVELLAVIVILAIVGAIAFVMIGNIIENSKKDAAVADALQAINSAKLYEASGEEIEESGVTVKKLHDDGYLDKLYDPWTKVEYGTGDSNKVTKTSSTNEENKEMVYKVSLDASKCKIN